jgi:hypothetical protein
MALCACGGANASGGGRGSGAPAGNYTIVVTGASGATTQSFNSLTVQDRERKRPRGNLVALRRCLGPSQSRIRATAHPCGKKKSARSIRNDGWLGARGEAKKRTGLELSLTSRSEQGPRLRVGTHRHLEKRKNGSAARRGVWWAGALKRRPYGSRDFKERGHPFSL